MLILRYREWDERLRDSKSPDPTIEAPLLASADRCNNVQGRVGLPGVLQLSADRADVWMWGKRVSTYSAAVQCLLVFITGMSFAVSSRAIDECISPLTFVSAVCNGCSAL